RPPRAHSPPPHDARPNSLQEKHQHPTPKHQKSSKAQAPIGTACFWAVSVDVRRRSRAIRTTQFRSESLELAIWSFSGAWILDVGDRKSTRLTSSHPIISY